MTLVMIMIMITIMTNNDYDNNYPNINMGHKLQIKKFGVRNNKMVILYSTIFIFLF